MIDIFTMLGASFFLVITLMCLLWAIYYFQRNTSLVDVGWALGFILSVWAYTAIGEGYFLKKLTIAIMVTVWAGRLVWHLSRRVAAGIDDPRYIELKKRLGPEYSDFKTFLLFLFQGLLVVILTIPFLIVCWKAQPGWEATEGVGILVWIIGVIGEALADEQLWTFKNSALNKGEVYRKGLWRFSRHPNYFFEFVVWIGFALFALPTPWGFLALISPGLILLFLLKISGIPLAEAQAEKSKGVQYEEYKKSTSAFIPWFPSREDSRKD